MDIWNRRPWWSKNSAPRQIKGINLKKKDLRQSIDGAKKHENSVSNYMVRVEIADVRELLSWHFWALTHLLEWWQIPPLRLKSCTMQNGKIHNTYLSHRNSAPLFLQGQFLFLPFTLQVVVAVAVLNVAVEVVVVVVVVVVVMVAVSIEVIEVVVVVAVVVVVEIIVSPKKVAVTRHFAVADGKFDVKHWQSVDLIKCPSSMLSF